MITIDKIEQSNIPWTFTIRTVATLSDWNIIETNCDSPDMRDYWKKSLARKVELINEWKQNDDINKILESEFNEWFDKNYTYRPL